MKPYAFRDSLLNVPITVEPERMSLDIPVVVELDDGLLPAERQVLESIECELADLSKAEHPAALLRLERQIRAEARQQVADELSAIRAKSAADVARLEADNDLELHLARQRAERSAKRTSFAAGLASVLMTLSFGVGAVQTHRPATLSEDYEVATVHETRAPSGWIPKVELARAVSEPAAEKEPEQAPAAHRIVRRPRPVAQPEAAPEPTKTCSEADRWDPLNFDLSC